MRADIKPNYFIYFCYGILVAFLVYSLIWWAEARETQTYGMKNTATSITLVSTRPEESKEKQIEVAKELRTFLKSKKVGLIKQSEGDGPPSIIVFDPDKQLPWAAPLSSNGTTDKSIFAISGSYSANTWIASKTSPLAPPETEVRGIISVPGVSSTSNLQFVERLGTRPLGTGTIQLGTTDTTIVAHAVEIMEKSGPEAVNIQQPPVVISLLRNAEIGVSGLFIMSGMTCIIALTALRASERKPENLLRMRVGATLRRLIIEQSLRNLPPILIGTTAGIGVATATTSVIAGSSPPMDEITILALGALAGTVIIWLLTTITLKVAWSRNLATPTTD